MMPFQNSAFLLFKNLMLILSVTSCEIVATESRDKHEFLRMTSDVRYLAQNPIAMSDPFASPSHFRSCSLFLDDLSVFIPIDRLAAESLRIHCEQSESRRIHTRCSTATQGRPRSIATLDFQPRPGKSDRAIEKHGRHEIVDQRSLSRTSSNAQSPVRPGKALLDQRRPREFNPGSIR